jgi:hypothetical protein
MKRLVLLTAGVVLVSSMNLWAAGPPAKCEAGPKAAKPANAAYYVERIDKAVGLTAEQKKAITEILEAKDKAFAEFQAQNGEKIKAAALAVAKANEAQNAAMKDYIEAHGKKTKEGEPMPLKAQPGNEEKVKAAKLALDKAREASAKASKEYSEVFAPTIQIHAKYDVMSVLTAEQKAKYTASLPKRGDKSRDWNKPPQPVQPEKK